MPSEPGSSNVAAGNLSLHEGRVVGLNRRLERDFSLQIAIPPFDAIALDVLTLIEKKHLTVFPPDTEIELEENFLAGASLAVPLLEWLPLGCQAIRWDLGSEISKLKNPRSFAFYRNNAPEIMFRTGSVVPPVGPAALSGEIVISQRAFPIDGGAVIEDQLRCVIAHELVHVFEVLRLLVPAALNWDLCWTNLLKDGDACDNAITIMGHHTRFLDNYESEDELALLQNYWPSYAEKWFTALRSKEDPESRGS